MPTADLPLIDYIMLGLLHRAPMSGYAIRKVLETTAMGNYSSSPGTVYPAIRRLQRLGLAASRPGGSARKTLLHLEPTGGEALRSWLERPVTADAVRKQLGELLLRFAFMEHLLPDSAQIRFLECLVSGLEQYVQELEAFLRNPNSGLSRNGKLALSHGLHSFGSSLHWAQSALHTLRSASLSTDRYET